MSANPKVLPLSSLFLCLLLRSVSYASVTNIAPIYGVASADAHTGVFESGAWSGGPPHFAIDGDPWTGWNAGNYGSPSIPHWLIVDLQNEYGVEQIDVVGGAYWEGSPYWGFTNEYNLYTSLNGIDWTLIASDSWAEDTDPAVYSDTFMLSGDPLQYVKYEVVGGSHWAGITEIEVFADVAGAPAIPAPGALVLAGIGAGMTSLLRWRRRL